ncbi:MAG: hypothetical protein R3D33_13740 [Hyphomicrobiaceae bacterium]
MIISRKTRVMVIGCDSEFGGAWVDLMADYGTNIVAWVTCGERKGAEKSEGPARKDAPSGYRGRRFDSIAVAVAETEPEVAFIDCAATKMRQAALGAIQARVRTLVIHSCGLPMHDVMFVLAMARDAGIRVFGPNEAGLAVPGEAVIGYFPAYDHSLFGPGGIAVITRLQSVAGAVLGHLRRAGRGVSNYIAIGADPLVGTSMAEAAALIGKDERMRAILLVGDTQGQQEEQAAEALAGLGRPVVSYLVGATGAGREEAFQRKRRALEWHGITVITQPSDAVAALRGVPMGAGS